MNAHSLAFFMGLVGSLHCVAMCGPLMLALPYSRKGRWQEAISKILYQLGRMLAYTAIGWIVGSLSLGISIQGWQQFLSITTGVLLLILAAIHWMGKQFRRLSILQQKMLTPLIKAMGYWLQKPGGNFMSGVLNGLLPCGMVYIALATALNTGGAWQGANFMLFFGLGTLPLLLTTHLTSSFVKKWIPFRLSTILPFLFLVMGSWFILRGANWDIPFLSPLLHPEGMLECR